ncbi:MAG: hypothetical protein GY757_05205, partial [bacterium]|nr:hypothetical protein [bacterium]
MIIQVSPSLNIFETLAYRYTGDPELLRPGLRVVIPIGTRITAGWVMETRSDYKGRVKKILAVVKDDYVPDEAYMEFVKAVSGVYFTSPGTLLDSSLSPKKKAVSSLYFENKTNGKTEKLNKYTPAELTKLAKQGAIECFYKGTPPPPTLPESPEEEPGTGDTLEA